MSLTLAMICGIWHQGKDNKEKNPQIGLYEKFSNFAHEREWQQSKKASDKMGENICKSMSDKGFMLRICRYSQKSTTERTQSKRDKGLEEPFLQEGKQIKVTEKIPNITCH